MLALNPYAIISYAVCLFFLTALINRFIGSKNWKAWADARAQRAGIPVRVARVVFGSRMIAYILSGLFAFTLAWLCGYAGAQAAAIGAAHILGYMAFRQPSENHSFFAGHGRYYPESGIRPINALVRWLFRFPAHQQMKGEKQLVRYGILWGTVRGFLLIMPHAILMALLTSWWALAFAGLGLLHGAIHYACGKFGLFSKEEGMRERAELTSGAIIVALNYILPIIVASGCECSAIKF